MDLDELNNSELAQLAQSMNPLAHRDLPREVLVALIQGEDYDLPDREVDAYRNRIFLFVDRNWEQVAPLVSCPLKDRDPRSCFTCTDIQVAECVTQNRSTFRFDEE